MRTAKLTVSVLWHPAAKQDLAKPYDPKKSCWYPLKEEGGFAEGIIEQAEGDKVSYNDRSLVPCRFPKISLREIM
jgi:hypothetical protein